MVRCLNGIQRLRIRRRFNVAYPLLGDVDGWQEEENEMREIKYCETCKHADFENGNKTEEE